MGTSFTYMYIWLLLAVCIAGIEGNPTFPSPTSVKVEWPRSHYTTFYKISKKLIKQKMCTSDPALAPAWVVDGRRQMDYSIDTTSATLSNLRPYSEYGIKVERGATWTHYSFYKSWSVTMPVAQPDDPPGIQQITSTSSDSFTASWSAPDCSKNNGPNIHYEYQVKRNTLIETFGNLGQALSITITSRSPFTTYTFQIKTCNTDNTVKRCSKWAEADVKTLETAPSCVTNLNVFPVSATSLEVSWNAPSQPNGHITRYEVEYKWIKRLACGTYYSNSYVLRSTYSGNRNHIINNLEKFSEYKIRVKACTGAGCGGFCGITVNKGTLAAAPSGTTSSPSIIRRTNVSFTVAWSAIPCAHRNDDNILYRYQVPEASTGDTDTTQTSVTITGLNPGTEYTFNVKVCNSVNCGEWMTTFLKTKETAVDGGWSAWSEWEPCSVPCDRGSQSRIRLCTKPAPAHGGNDCEGPDTETQTCNTHNCPINGGWSFWSNWGPCSISCGGGYKSRSRACTKPKPQHGGEQCAGLSVGREGCNAQNCPRDGGWSTWNEWEPCSVSCAGGNQSRSRSCTKPEPAHGGNNCEGSHNETLTCNTLMCPRDGGWTTWSNWGPCSVSCAGGSRSRSRSCTDPEPAYGGDYCNGSLTAIQACNRHMCPNVSDGGTPVVPLQGGIIAGIICGVLGILFIAGIIGFVLYKFVYKREITDSSGPKESSIKNSCYDDIGYEDVNDCDKLPGDHVERNDNYAHLGRNEEWEQSNAQAVYEQLNRIFDNKKQNCHM